MFLVKVFCSEQNMTISAIDIQLLAKLHTGFERAYIREVLNIEKQSLGFQVRNPVEPQTSC